MAAAESVSPQTSLRLSQELGVLVAPSASPPGFAGLKRCLCAGCWPPHACPLGMRIAQRCSNLQLAFVHCVLLYLRHSVFLPCVSCRFCMACVSCAVLVSFSMVRCGLLGLPGPPRCMRCRGRRVGAGSRLQQAVHVTPDVGKFMQCLVQGELLVLYEACDAVPELAIRVQELRLEDTPAGAGSPDKKPRTATHYKGQTGCRPNNDNRGCPEGCGKSDACDVILPDGAVCASCPHRLKAQ